MSGWGLYNPPAEVIADGGHQPVIHPRPAPQNLVAETRRLHKFHVPNLQNHRDDDNPVILGQPVAHVDFLYDNLFGTLFLSPGLWAALGHHLAGALGTPVEVRVRRERNKTSRTYVAAGLLARNVMAEHTDWSATRFHRADSYELRYFRDGWSEADPIEPQPLAFAGHDALVDDRAQQENWLKDYLPRPWVLRGLAPVAILHVAGGEILMSPALVAALTEAGATGWRVRPALYEPTFG